MRIAPILALALVPLAGRGQAPDAPPLAQLVQDILEANPEAARTRALAQAEGERIPQAGALPDPFLSLGLQNDGFRRIQVGRMETSYYQVMLTQPLPWPGKRELRREIARMGARTANEAATRTRLGLEAEARRGYTALLLVRGQQRLLEDQALFLAQAEATARTRYEVGQGSQADLLRAQLERTRLEATRLRLRGQERGALAALNRLRARPQDTPLATPGTLEQVPDPAPLDPEAALREARALSPERRSAELGEHQAATALELARLDQRPDFAVGAGLMPRGGLDPMWTATVSISLPLWRSRKQSRAVAEREGRHRASGFEREALDLLLAQRVQERATEMEAALGVLRLYRSGLLVQSEASFRAALAQYEVGRAPFLTVLEALNGWIADQSGLLQAQAGAQAILIAQGEATLAPTPAIGAASLGAGAMTSVASPPAQPGAASPSDSPSGSPSGSPSESMPSM